MATPLMPKATAVWLVENSTLTFEQVSIFTGLHILEVQAIADGEVAIGMVGRDPLVNNELTKQEIARCEADPAGRLELLTHDRPQPTLRAGGPRYTPVAKRQDRPDAIAWLLKNHGELQDSQIARLVGSTKNTIQAIRDRSHWNSVNIKQRDPITLGLCTIRDLNAAIEKARVKAAREESAKKKAAAMARQAAGLPEPEPVVPEEQPGFGPEDIDTADMEAPVADETNEDAATVDLSEADQPEV